MEEIFKNKDNILVQKIIEGDSNAEKYLVNNYQGKIAWFVKRKIGVSNDYWKDLVIETLMATLESIKSGKFDPDKGKIGSYIYGIARNKINDYCKNKKQYSVKKLSEVDIINPGEQLKWEEEQQAKERLVVLRSLLTKLKPKYQEVIYLKYYKDLSMKRIGDKIKKTEQQVINLHNYALRKIREESKKKKYFSIFLFICLIYL